MSDKRGVVVVGDDDAGDAFGAAVGVEGVVCCFFVRRPSVSYHPSIELRGTCLAPRHLAVARVESALRLSC